jgi:type IV secretion system protein VirB2
VTVAGSLFDAPPGSPMTSATDWLTRALSGNLAISLCVIAVTFVGLMLMTGRLAVRDGLRVALGCFVLLGAPVIAAGLRTAADATWPGSTPHEPLPESSPQPPPLPPASYDPYAGASLRRD